jgi:hypothetical protein
MNTVVAVVIVSMLVIAYTGIVLSGGIMVLKRRKVEPLRSRRPRMVLLGICGLWGFVIPRVILRELQLNSINCFVSLIVPLNLLVMSTTILLSRAFILAVDFAKTREAVEFVKRYHDTMNRDDLKQVYNSLPLGRPSKTDFPVPAATKVTRGSFFLSHRKWFATSFLWKVFLVCVAVEWFVLDLLQVLIEPQIVNVLRSDTLCLAAMNRSAIIEVTVVLVEVLLLIAVCFKVRNVHENFGIRDELYRSSAAFIFIAVFLTVNVATDNEAENTFATSFGVRCYNLIGNILPSMFIVYESLFRPWRASFIQGVPEEIVESIADLKNPSSKELYENFIEMLHDPRGYDVFAEFLEAEFSIENLLFWRDVQTFKDGSPGSRIEAGDIYHIYIDLNSPLCTNIAGHIRLNIKKNLNIAAAEKKIAEAASEQPAIAIPSASAIAARPSVLARVGNATPRSSDLKEPSVITPSVPKDLFDEAVTEILMLMYRDSFCRFRFLPKYKQFTKSVMSTPRSSATRSSKVLVNLESISFGTTSMKNSKSNLQPLLTEHGAKV